MRSTDRRKAIANLKLEKKINACQENPEVSPEDPAKEDEELLSKYRKELETLEKERRTSKEIIEDSVAETFDSFEEYAEFVEFISGPTLTIEGMCTKVLNSIEKGLREILVPCSENDSDNEDDIDHDLTIGTSIGLQKDIINMIMSMKMMELVHMREMMELMKMRMNMMGMREMEMREIMEADIRKIMNIMRILKIREYINIMEQMDQLQPTFKDF